MTRPQSHPSAGYYDAHLHLHDENLQMALRKAKAVQPSGRIMGQLTNGTSPEDWDRVAALSGGQVRAAYGVHPWKVDHLPEDWEEGLRQFLLSGAASVGEIGLDNWIEPRDSQLQMEIFERQLVIAGDLGLAPSIHCLRAWGALVDCLRRGPDLPRGFLVHGFGGSRETLFELLDLGGCFSFSAYAADPGRKRMRDAARACPPDRILVETDAPDMVPPEEVCRFPLVDDDGQRLHHPEEIATAYAFLANWRDDDLEVFAEQVAGNFQRLFG